MTVIPSCAPVATPNVVGSPAGYAALAETARPPSPGPRPQQRNRQTRQQAVVKNHLLDASISGDQAACAHWLRGSACESSSRSTPQQQPPAAPAITPEKRNSFTHALPPMALSRIRTSALQKASHHRTRPPERAESVGADKRHGLPQRSCH